MGPRLKLPPYVHAFIDRHGKPRFYFRRPGYKRAPLPGLPWSAEFMAAYEAAKKGETAPRLEIGADRSRPGTVNAAVAGYFGSLAFASLADGTRRIRRQLLERFRTEHGDKGIATLARTHVERMLDAKAATPGAALNFLVALRGLMRHAVAVGLRADDPTSGVRCPTFRSAGFYTWTDDDIIAFEAKHPIGTQPRLALALLLYTAQRRSDVIKIGRQHIRDGLVHVRQSKTGTALMIPVHPELQTVLDATPTEHLTFLTTHGGRPFKPDVFTRWFKAQCGQAGLPARASVHGLRAIGRGRCKRQHHRQHQRPPHPAGGGTLHSRRRPGPPGPPRHRGFNANKNWQTTVTGLPISPLTY
jgi:integrase